MFLLNFSANSTSKNIKSFNVIIADKSTSCLKIGTPAEKYKGVFFPKVARNDEEKLASQNPEIETSKAEEESLH